MKSSISFVCQECGYDSPQWLGRCPECGAWNSLKEFKVQSFLRSRISLRETKFKLEQGKEKLEEIKPKTLNEIKTSEKERLSTGFLEMDGVLGGGIVPGSVTLLAGDPGVGKSTLLLQIGLNLASTSFQKTQNTQHIRKSDNQIVRQSDSPSFPSVLKVLYISGEESAEQVKLRISRIYKGLEDNKNILILSSTDTDMIQGAIEKIKPNLVIIDSIQTMESESMGGLPGSVGQVRYAASQFIKSAKTLNIPIFIVGHVTKEGMVAGPMVLSHMVDAALFLEGEKFTNTRILRGLKNRFGPVDEVGIFTMEEKGIKETNAPEQLFLTKNLPNHVNGSVISVTLEGSRAFLVEIQALVVSSKIPIPRRVSSGIDYKRLELLLAVLQKHCNLPLGLMDVFVNVAGGLRLSDPGVDLGICLAIFSSFKNIPLSDTVAVSEVGLLGELREIQSLDKRVKEAQKLGFKNIISYDTHKILNEAIRSLSK